ncbi:FGGY family carbohydrate kinase [Chitinophaga sedimenti]|uniref:FGGY family carbohydrate kinase n=1 Tax=Chitinophaga sedimenti TaxID=2033606 RepID=UPI00249E3F97|nr:FGGY family carbohydrate kinase [Chitinophaga sedimenti]
MSDQASYILGVDIGTSSTKTIAVLRNGKVVTESRQSYPTHNPQPGQSEQDAIQLCEAVLQTIRDAVQQMGYAPTAVSFSSAMHSFMAVDADGRPLTPLIIWSDNRAEAAAISLRDTPEGKAIFRQTGTPIHPMSPLCKLMWMREHATTVFESATFSSA